MYTSHKYAEHQKTRTSIGSLGGDKTQEGEKEDSNEGETFNQVKKPPGFHGINVESRKKHKEAARIEKHKKKYKQNP